MASSLSGGRKRPVGLAQCGLHFRHSPLDSDIAAVAVNLGDVRHLRMRVDADPAPPVYEAWARIYGGGLKSHEIRPETGSDRVDRFSDKDRSAGGIQQ